MRIRRSIIIPILLSPLILAACTGETGSSADATQSMGGEFGVATWAAPVEEKTTAPSQVPRTTAAPSTIAEEPEPTYILPEGTTLQTRIAVPEGYVRTAYAAGSFGAFVRDYLLKPDGSPVLLWTREPKADQESHAAVFDMPVEEEMDVQQCADSVMRIYAEYFRVTGQYDRIKFHFVGGFLCDYNKYIQGYRIRQSGDEFTWKQTKKAEDSDEVFNDYMFMVCAYASTLSMKGESKEIDLQDLRIGDIFLKAGSPGHVVMVADICEKDGKKAFLLAQGYMPAQEFHIIKNPRHSGDPWYYEEEVTYPFRTQAYTFSEGSLRRPEY